MSNEKFTQKAETALNNSLDLAERLGSQYIGTEHILLSLLETQGSIAWKLLCEAGVSKTRYLEEIESKRTNTGQTKLTVKNMTPRARCVLDDAYKNAVKYGALRIGTEHILLALLEEKETVGLKLLELIGADVRLLKDKTRQKIDECERAFGRIEDSEKKGRSDLPVLMKYGKVMNDPSKEAAWEIVGRDGVIERLIRTLSRKTKNNPVLLGEAGVGKTAIVEGLARRMTLGDVPPSLRSSILISLDLTRIVAGTKYRGDFEERIRQILDEAKKNTNVILFIDEIHTVIGAGAAEGAVDLANIMKPELSRAEIRLIGATTHDEYRRNIEKDSALERRFQPIFVEEPTVQESCIIVRSIAQTLEKHHQVKIEESAIHSSVELSTRYLFLRSRPDKCIDLLDEACAYATLHKKKSAEVLPIVTRRELLCVMEELYGNKAPLDNLPHSEDGLTDILSDMCIGQEEACRVVARGVLRSQSGVQDPTKPLGSYFFYGASGVGKTKMARSIAKLLFDNEERCITFDMSEYNEPHSVSRLIGAPQGYIGYGEGGLLTQAVRKNPFCVLLFDEIEKAHREIYHLFLQILEDGRLTDSNGKTVSFRNCFIVFTSNVAIKDSVALGFGSNENAKTSVSEMFRSHFPAEFISRVDVFVKFNQLTRENLYKICEMELEALKSRLMKENIILRFDESVLDTLLCDAYQSNLGARPIRTRIRAMLEGKIAEYIMNHKTDEEIYAFERNGEIVIAERAFACAK